MQQQNEEHVNLARHKCVVYIPDNNTLKQLNSFVSQTSRSEPVLVVTGPSGSGKSSLIAYWWLSMKGDIPSFF